MQWIGLLAVLLAAGAMFVYMVFVEPNKLVVAKVPFTFGEGKRVLRVVQLADLHLGLFAGLKRLDKVIDAIQNEKPDLIICSGDIIDDPPHFHLAKETAERLQRLHAPYGKLAVWGNHEYRGVLSLYKEMMGAAGFLLLKNNWIGVLQPDGSRIGVAGLDDGKFGNPDVSVFVDEDYQKTDLRIGVIHEPDFAELIPEKATDLILSGHTHGGQVRLPGIGAVFTPKYGRKYIKGTYRLNGMQLYVDSGAGGGLPIRFMNPPQISVLELWY